MKEFTASCSGQIEQLKQALETADAVLIGAGSGLSTSAGLTYSGERFERYFSDFHQKYGITDIYSGGFYPFDTLEEYWAWWSRHIFYNRYVDAPLPVYQVLLALVKDKDYFVLTTNVDHQFQRSGFDKKRLFYTQGDYGLWQCSKACHCKTYDNENTVRQMVARQRAMRIPTELIPRCPVCGAPMTMNLRCDDTFVQDEGWYAAQSRYSDFVRRHKHEKVLYGAGCGKQYAGYYQVSVLEIYAGKPRRYLCLCELRAGICTKGNCKAFHLFGCGHWTYSIRAGPKGGFVKNGQSFYHAGWRLCPFFIFKARHPNCILTVWIPTAAENAGGFQRRAALRTHSSKATMVSFGSISFSQLRRCAIALFAKRFVFIVSQSASRMISAVSFSKST